MHKNGDTVCTRLEVQYAVGSENDRGWKEPLGLHVQPPAQSRATSVLKRVAKGHPCPVKFGKSPRMEIQHPFWAPFSRPRQCHSELFPPPIIMLSRWPRLSSQCLSFIFWVYTRAGRNNYGRFKASKHPPSDIDLPRAVLGLMPCKCCGMSSGPCVLAAAALPSPCATAQPYPILPGFSLPAHFTGLQD